MRIYSSTTPEEVITIRFLGFPELVPAASIFLTTSSYPWITSPKTVCFPSNQLVTSVVMKNYTTAKEIVISDRGRSQRYT